MHGSENSGEERPASTDGDSQRTAPVFECDHCGTRRVQRVLSYDRFGFPICPVCDRPNRPERILIE